MSRANRLIQRQQAKQAKKATNSTYVQEQLNEEQEVADSKVTYVEKQGEPLEYIHEGVKYVVPCLTDDGKTMSYHDQYYQITRMKNGLPIEAKRMLDYRFDIEAAEVVKSDDRSGINLDIEPSDTYQNLKDAHEAQHPPEEDEE